MQVFTNPGRGEARGQTVSEVRIELAARRDHTTGSMVYVNERHDGTLLVTVARGSAEMRHVRQGRGPAVNILVVEPTTVPEP